MLDKIHPTYNRTNINIDWDYGLLAIAAGDLLQFVYRNNIEAKDAAAMWNNVIKMVDHAKYTLAVLKQEREKEEETEQTEGDECLG